MTDFTATQMAIIGDSYELMAKTLTEFQLVRWSEFTHEQQLDLNAYQHSLLNRAHDLQTRAINPAVDRAEALTEAIQQTINQICTRLLTSNIPLALAMSAMTVALASYVSRSNRDGVQSAFDRLRNLMETGSN